MAENTLLVEVTRVSFDAGNSASAPEEPIEKPQVLSANNSLKNSVKS